MFLAQVPLPRNLYGAPHLQGDALHPLKTTGLDDATSQPYSSMVKSTKQHRHTAAGSSQYSELSNDSVEAFTWDVTFSCPI